MPSRRSLLAAALAVALFAGLRLAWSPGLLGFAGGEVYGHAWVQTWHAAALPAWPVGTDLAVGASRWPVIDPLPTLLAAALGRVFGVIIGYNAWILLSVALAFFGGAALARREGGDPWVGGLCLALAPCFVGSLASGLTEDGAVGLAALGLSFLRVRSPREGLAAGLCLGLLASCGLVLAWAAAVTAVGLGLASLAADRRAWRALALGALVAALLAAPVAWSQGDRLAGIGHRLGAAPESVEALWRLNPWRGLDLLSLVAPGRQDPGDALIRLHPGYLGLVPLGLALFAGRSRWWGVLLVASLVALGPRLSLAGRPLGLDNPAASLAHLLPGGALLNHHGRVLLIGAIALAALAAKGAARLAEGRPWIARAAAGLVALDLLVLSPLSLPLPVAEAGAPDVAARLDGLPPGAVLPVPFAGPGVHPQRALLDQRVHGRPLAIAPNRPGLTAQLSRSATARWLAALTDPRAGAPPAEIDPIPGVAVLLVQAPYVAAVAAALGPPDVAGEHSAAWAAVRIVPQE